MASSSSVANLDDTVPVSEKMVRLKTSSGLTMEVDGAVAERCEAIKNLMEDGCGEGVIPVANVEWEALKKVVEWCQHEVGMGVLEEEEKKKWEGEFVDSCNTTELYHMIMAANYLSVPRMVDRLAKKVADLIKGKHPDEIRRIFQIQNDFEPEQYQKIVADNSWAFVLH